MFTADFALRLLGMRLKNRALIGPEVVQIDLTDDCTNNCLGCWARSPFLRDEDHYDTLEKGTLDTSFVMDLLPQLAAIGVETIFLGGGGDPLCHPDFLPIVKKIKEIGFKCTVNTNFMLATPELLQSLIDIGLDELIVSLWAADTGMYARLHPNQSEGTFRHLENMLRYLADRKSVAEKPVPKVKIYNVICSINYEQIPEMIEFGREFGAEEVEFSIFDPIPRRTHIFLLQPKHIKWIDKFLKNFKQHEAPFVHHELFLRRLHNVDVLKGVYDNGIVESIPCAAGWFYARVTTVGQVHSCLKAHRIAAGELTTHKFGQIWYGEGQDRFRENTVKLKYDNPFLEMIGHDIDFALPGCYRICDNLGHNQHIMRQSGALTDVERECLDAMEAAAKSGATIERLRAIHADFEANSGVTPLTQNQAVVDVEVDHPILARNGFAEMENQLAKLGETDTIRIPVTIDNLARLPKLLGMIHQHTGRTFLDVDARFEFSPIADAYRRVGPFLKTLKDQLAPFYVHLVPDLIQIEKTLASFSQGLAKYSEADLLPTLGVLCNDQLIGPRTFHLDVANGCNTDCIYCWFHSPFSKDRVDAEKFDAKWKSTLMPFEIFTKLVDDLAELRCNEDIVLSGKGEPLVHPRIIDMVKYIKGKGLATTLFTNGLLLDEKMAQACVDEKVDMVYVSLSAATKQTYEKLQTKPPAGSFEKIVDNVKRLVTLKNKAKSDLPKVVMVDVLCNRNVDEIEEFAKLSADIGVDLLRYQLAAIEPYNKTLKLSDEQLKKVPDAIEQAKAIAKEAGMDMVANIDAQLQGGDSNWSGETFLKKGCLAGWAFSRAWADGTLSLCCSPKPIGSLEDDRFANWWAGETYDTHRLAAKYIADHKDHRFADGTPLWNDICRRCPNYEGIGHLEEILEELGLM